MNASEQIEQARKLGMDSAQAGKLCVPVHDDELMAMLRGRKAGETPPGEASSLAILKAWQAGFLAETLGQWDTV